MILGTIHNYSRYEELGKGVQTALKYLAEHENELENLSAGKYEINGDNVNFSVMEFEAAKPEEKFFETHDEHIDIHVTLKGNEWYGYAPAEKMTSEKSHNAEKDNRHFYDRWRRDHSEYSQCDHRNDAEAYQAQKIELLCGHEGF